MLRFITWILLFLFLWIYQTFAWEIKINPNDYVITNSKDWNYKKIKSNDFSTSFTNSVIVHNFYSLNDFYFIRNDFSILDTNWKLVNDLSWINLYRINCSIWESGNCVIFDHPKSVAFLVKSYWDNSNHLLFLDKKTKKYFHLNFWVFNNQWNPQKYKKWEIFQKLFYDKEKDNVTWYDLSANAFKTWLWDFSFDYFGNVLDVYFYIGSGNYNSAALYNYKINMNHIKPIEENIDFYIYQWFKKEDLKWEWNCLNQWECYNRVDFKDLSVFYFKQNEDFIDKIPFGLPLYQMDLRFQYFEPKTKNFQNVIWNIYNSKSTYWQFYSFKIFLYHDMLFYCNRNGLNYRFYNEDNLLKTWKINSFFDSFFNNYKSCDLNYDNEEKRFYISMIFSNQLNYWLKTISFTNVYGSADYLDNNYYIASFIDKDKTKSNLYLSNDFLKDINLTNNSFIKFLRTKSWNWYIYFLDKNWNVKNYSFQNDFKELNLTSNNFIDKNPDWTDKDSSGWDLSDQQKDSNVVFNAIKEKIVWLLWWIKDVVEFFILPFPSEKETYSIILPFLEFNKNKVNYKKLTADLPNFNNYKTYAVVNISDSDNNKLWKKFLSFLLWIFYILVRFFLIFFFFIPFFLYYFIAEKLTSFIFWWLWSASENWWVISKPISFLYYSSILVPLVWILVWLLIFIPMFNVGFDYINNIFWYILSNYLDYSFFVWFVNWFFVFLWFWIISHLVYIFFKNK